MRGSPCGSCCYFSGSILLHSSLLLLLNHTGRLRPNFSHFSHFPNFRFLLSGADKYWIVSYSWKVKVVLYVNQHIHRFILSFFTISLDLSADWIIFIGSWKLIDLTWRKSRGVRLFSTLISDSTSQSLFTFCHCCFELVGLFFLINLRFNFFYLICQTISLWLFVWHKWTLGSYKSYHLFWSFFSKLILQNDTFSNS